MKEISIVFDIFPPSRAMEVGNRLEVLVLFGVFFTLGKN